MARHRSSSRRHSSRPADDTCSSTDSNHRSMTDTALTRRGCSFGSCIVPFLVFISFFLNFVYSDVGRASDKFDTVLTPPHFAFIIWIVIYVLEFIFVIYQLFTGKARNSSLIQKGIALPFVFHQILTASWLLVFSHEKIYESTILVTLIWLICLGIFGTIAREFRTGRYRFYSVTDFCFIEVPFAVLLGWETLATIVSWNIFVVKMTLDGRISAERGISAQVLMAIIGFVIVGIAAILFAGLPMLMNPFVHLPLIWGMFAIGYRWTVLEPTPAAAQLSWATQPIVGGIGLAAWFTMGVCALFFLVAGIILGSSRLCLPASMSSMSALSDSLTSESDRDRPVRGRSPHTARSAMSAERV